MMKSRIQHLSRPFKNLLISHKKISVQVLNFNHKNQILDLIQKRIQLKLMGWKIDEKTLDRFLNPNSKLPVFFGAFQKNKLIYMMGLEKMKNLPYVMLDYRLSDLGSRIFNSETNGQNLCLEKAVDYGEKNGIIAYYYFHKKTDVEKTRLKAKIKLPENYVSYTEATIPKNTCPKVYTWWLLMGEETKPYTGEVRRMFKKQN